MSARKRREDETYEDYREALYIEGKSLKRYLKGFEFHDSKNFGTYRKKKDADIN